MKPRTTIEYRVLSQRQGNAVTEKRYRSLTSVLNRIGRLTSDEPWRFYGDEYTKVKGPNDWVCCRGTERDECACGGLTMRESTAETRKNLPPIEWVRVESRRITRSPWILNPGYAPGFERPAARLVGPELDAKMRQAGSE